MPAPKTPAAVLESGDRLTRPEFHRRYCTLRLHVSKMLVGDLAGVLAELEPPDS